MIQVTRVEDLSVHQLVYLITRLDIHQFVYLIKLMNDMLCVSWLKGSFSGKDGYGLALLANKNVNNLYPLIMVEKSAEDSVLDSVWEETKVMDNVIKCFGKEIAVNKNQIVFKLLLEFASNIHRVHDINDTRLREIDAKFSDLGLEKRLKLVEVQPEPKCEPEPEREAEVMVINKKLLNYPSSRPVLSIKLFELRNKLEDKQCLKKEGLIRAQLEVNTVGLEVNTARLKKLLLLAEVSTASRSSFSGKDGYGFALLANKNVNNLYPLIMVEKYAEDSVLDSIWEETKVMDNVIKCFDKEIVVNKNQIVFKLLLEFASNIHRVHDINDTRLREIDAKFSDLGLEKRLKLVKKTNIEVHFDVPKAEVQHEPKCGPEPEREAELKVINKELLN
ncbi:hypothetical protein Tco_1086425 [Tanacetum coccineum]